MYLPSASACRRMVSRYATWRTICSTTDRSILDGFAIAELPLAITRPLSRCPRLTASALCRLSHSCPFHYAHSFAGNHNLFVRRNHQHLHRGALLCNRARLAHRPVRGLVQFHSEGCEAPAYRAADLRAVLADAA